MLEDSFRSCENFEQFGNPEGMVLTPLEATAKQRLVKSGQNLCVL